MTDNDNPWLRVAFDDVCDRIKAMVETRGDRAFSREENVRYAKLVRELAETSTAMHKARRARGTSNPTPPAPKRTFEYHCETDTQKYIANPIRSLVERLQGFTQEIITENQQRQENHERHDITEQARHTQQIDIQKNALRIQKISTGVAACLSTATLFVLWLTFGVYSRQAGIMTTQAKIMAKVHDDSERDFKLIQRARMALGNDKGVLMDFLKMKEKHFISLYFRNIGHIPANNVIVDVFTLTPLPEAVIDNVGLPDENQPHPTGPPVPPGSPYSRYWPYDLAKQTAVEKDKATLEVFGRVQYSDDFGTYCEPFCADFTAGIVSQFQPCPPIPTVCEHGVHPVRMNRVTVTSKHWTTVWPPEKAGQTVNRPLPSPWPPYNPSAEHH